jgi:hypothetical protein
MWVFLRSLDMARAAVWAAAFRPRQRSDWATTTGGGGSIGDIRFRPKQRRQHSDWAAATFGFGRQFTGRRTSIRWSLEEYMMFCFLAYVEEVVECFVSIWFFCPMLMCQPLIGKQKMPSFCNDRIEVIPNKKLIKTLHIKLSYYYFIIVYIYIQSVSMICNRRL